MLLKGSQDHTCTIQSFIVFVMYFLIIKAKKKPVTVHGFIELNLKQIVSGKKDYIVKLLLYFHSVCVLRAKLVC